MLINVLASIIGGLLLGGLAAIGLEFLDRRIRNPRINAEQRERFKLAPTENISDMDLVEHQHRFRTWEFE